MIILATAGCAHDALAHCSSAVTATKLSNTSQISSAVSTQYCREETEVVAKRISSKLSPAAKKLTLKRSSEQVDALIQVVGHVDYEELAKSVAEAGALVRSWNPEVSLLTVEAPANCLSLLAEIAEIVYIEISSPYQR